MTTPQNIAVEGLKPGTLYVFRLFLRVSLLPVRDAEAHNYVHSATLFGYGDTFMLLATHAIGFEIRCTCISSSGVIWYTWWHSEDSVFFYGYSGNSCKKIFYAVPLNTEEAQQP
jgi:hypothetical protein